MRPDFKSEFIFFLLPSFLLLFVNPKQNHRPFFTALCMFVDTQWGHFMSVEIVIIDAVLFRYISYIFPCRQDKTSMENRTSC